MPLTIFAVYEYDEPIAPGESAIYFGTSNTEIRYEKNAGGNGHTRAMTADGSTELTGSAEDTEPHYGTHVFDGASSLLRVDGVLDASGDVGTESPATEGLSIGAARNGADEMEGVIAELIWYEGRLTDIEILQMESWLKRKWELY